MNMKKASRSSSAYQRARAAFRKQARANNLPCAICGQPINYNLHAGHPEAYETDHIIPVTGNQALDADATNFQPSHRLCNQTKGNKVSNPTIGTTSRNWLNH